MIIFAFLLFSIPKASAEPTLELIKNDVSLTHACSYYKLRLDDHTLKNEAGLLAKLLTLKVSKVKQVFGKLNDISLEIKTNVTYQVQVPDYEKAWELVELSNATTCENAGCFPTEEEGICNCSFNKLVGYHPETRWKWEWIPIFKGFYKRKHLDYKKPDREIFDKDKLTKHIPSLFKLAKEKKEIEFRICGNYQFERTSNGWSISIDHIPSFNNKEFTEFTWWNGTWLYRKPIIIQENSGNTLTDYQVRLEIDTATLISEGKMNSDCSDIRFTYYNESDNTETEIPYWIESGYNSANTVIWVKVPYIPASGTTTIYMYYGNPSATSKSNPYNVFEVYDDFETDPSSRWIAIRGSVRTISDIDGTALRLLGGSSDTIRYATNFTDWDGLGFVINFKVKWASFGWAGPRLNMRISNDSASAITATVERGGGYNNNRMTGLGFSTVSNTQDWTTGTVYNFLFYRKSNQLYWSRDGGSTTFLSSSGNAQKLMNEIFFQLYTWDSGNDVRIDNVIVRKYTEPEPTYTIGIQEIQNLTINLPYGNTYGKNETIFINGTTYPNITVYLYFYNSSLSLASATFIDSTLSDSNGNYNFTWYYSIAGNFTLYVNTSEGSHNSTNVSIIEPVTIEDLTSPEWFYDISQEKQNYFTQFVNFTINRNITKIEFSNSNSHLQPFYLENLYGAYTDCFNKGIGENCYVVYRYNNLPLGNNNLNFNYKIFYSNGNFYSNSFTSIVNVNYSIKRLTYYTISSGWHYIANSTETYDGVVGDACWCGGCGSNVDKYTITWDTSNLTFNVNISNASFGIVKVSIYYEPENHDGLEDVSFDAKVYLDGNFINLGDGFTVRQGWCTGAGWSEWIGHEGGSYLFKIESGYHTIEVEPINLPGVCYRYGAGNVKASITVYVFNKTKIEEVNLTPETFSSPRQKIFNTSLSLNKLSDKSYLFLSLYDPYQTSSNYWNAVFYTILNNYQTTNMLEIAIGEPDETYTLILDFDKKLITYNNNLTYYFMEEYEPTDTYEYRGITLKVGKLYYGVNDFDITLINLSHNNLSNLKDISTNILWLGLDENQTLTYHITNTAPYNYSNVHLTLYSSFFRLEKTISLNSGETKEVTFSIPSYNLEVLRGFGLDTIFLIAKTDEGAFGFTYNTFRFLPFKTANISVSVPPQVQAGGLFSIYTTFSPLNYSLFYPHIMLDLSGTFGFEVGVSSANIGESYTSGRCFDVTIWSSMYEPGVTLAYTTTTSGTFFTIDSLRMVPQHRFYIYDRYGFLNEPKGNESYILGKILVGYGVLEPGDWDMYGSYDFMVNGFSAETGVIFSDWSLGHQYLYKFLDITEVPQSINIISGPDQPLPTQLFNWIGFYPRNFPIFIYQSGSNLYVRNFPTDPTTYWIPCMSAGYAPIVPPFNLYIEYIKEGTDAFTIPAGQRLAVIDNQWVEPGEWAEGITFKALAPLDPGVYNITVIVWDDAETGLYWTKTVQIQVVSTIPSPGIVVREEDYALETVKAVEVGQANWITMKREVWVRNENPYRVALAVWYASPLPEDAIYLSGALSGTITDLASEAEVNPSNITYKVPGISAWVDKYIYAIGEPQTTKKLIYLRLKIFNNATKTPQYNIIVNRSEFVPTGFEPAEETITINSLAPQTYTTDYFYALGDTLEYPINYTIEEEKTIEAGLSKIKWTINFTNTLSEVANYTYRVYLPFEADNVTLDGSPVDVTLDTFGKYIDIDLNLDVSESETHTIEFSVLPVSIDISPPKYPLRFWVGQYANIIIDILVKNLATVSVNQTSVKIDIPYGENVTVYLEGYEVDRVDLVKGYYELNITNLTAGEARSYQIIFKSPTAEAIAGKYSGRRIINGTQYLMYPIYVKSVAAFPLTNLSMRLEVRDPFKCYDLKFCWLTDKDTYLNPPKGEELDLDCEDSKTAILDIGELSVGGEKYITCFLREKERPAPVLPDIYNFFDWLINAIKNFINWLIGLFK